MRISTSWSYQSAVNNMLNQQSNLNQTQMEISTGKSYLTPSGNPVVAASLINFNENIAENQQYQVNIGAAQASLQLETSSLSSATSTLQSIRDLTVQGLNGVNSTQNLQQIASQVDQLNQQLLGIANKQDANGDYVFPVQPAARNPMMPQPVMFTKATPGRTTSRSVLITGKWLMAIQAVQYLARCCRMSPSYRPI